ncbi:penicillin-binding transpeptidase domain-containing protein [Faecalibacterium duncaniae]|uniref:Penicillin-binding protein, transpeptidase domain protein n=1 Tax=Faecalibacterium duncaniae (strain DSM 17677 / JCM 31915 / A2-165) TaxID=411483 RepID=C7H5D7_FAED2|nr:penicillin-binding transpeptidase domain-containing protein [Faecalibacterium duncaniae]EEU96918.1 penicillin-binding protein, transpeptidase domain protein [Faecalibacterium duncaniae]
MSGKRVLALYGALLFCFAAVVCRLYWLCSDTDYGARAAAQSVVTLHLPARRGNFYDHRGQLLTGQTTRWMALCVPGEGSYARLFAYTDAAGQAALYQKRNAASPFLLEVDRDVSALGVSCWPAARRSSAAPLAVQLLGYLDGEGHGAAGLEAAFDELLTGSGAGDTLLCTVNAQGKLRAEPVLTPADSGAVGVQLTLSREIQQTAEAVANETMQSGCILVLDTANAKVRACVSRPGYDPENISASLNAPDSPLLERAFQCYAVGSVFKPVVAAAALEAGESGFVYTCPGWCAVDGRIFRCAGGIPHGEVDLAGALEKSCNGYFIRLGQALGADAVRAMAEQLGFGQAIPLTDALHTAAGVLPEREALASSGAYANFCFGQGELLASPLAGRRHDEHHCLRGESAAPRCCWRLLWTRPPAHHSRRFPMSGAGGCLQSAPPPPCRPCWRV